MRNLRLNTNTTLHPEVAKLTTLSYRLTNEDSTNYEDIRKELIQEIKSRVQEIDDSTNNATDFVIDLMTMLKQLK